jgi:hypothetical protein
MRTAWIALLSVFIVVPARAADLDETWHHVILRDGQPIGSSFVRFERSGGNLVVVTEASAQVRAGFLSLFEYRHTAREVWHGERLMALDTQTNDNGQRMTVTGRAVPDGFRVEGMDGVILVPADIRPTSYWRQDAVAQRRLLDTETGRILSIAATPIAGVGPSDQNAPRRYRLSGGLKHELELSYHGGRLLSGRFRKLGSDIEFRAADFVPPIAVFEPASDR